MAGGEEVGRGGEAEETDLTLGERRHLAERAHGAGAGIASLHGAGELGEQQIAVGQDLELQRVAAAVDQDLALEA